MSSIFTKSPNGNTVLSSQKRYYLSNNIPPHQGAYEVDGEYLSEIEKISYEMQGIKVKKLGGKPDLSKHHKFSADLSDFG